MAVRFDHVRHPRIDARKTAGPPRTTDVPPSLNGRIAVVLTRIVGTMWCAYAFALLALVALPDALGSGGLLPLVQWVSQTFIQLVMLSVIMVGQNILATASDRRADMTYQDADATFHEAGQIQEHLKVQDAALTTLFIGERQLHEAQREALDHLAGDREDAEQVQRKPGQHAVAQKVVGRGYRPDLGDHRQREQ